MGIIETIGGWLLKAREVSPRLMAVLALISGALLFCPDHILAHFAVDVWVSTHRPLIGLLFLFSGGMTLSYPVEAGWRWLNRCIVKSQLTSAREKRLQSLDNREKQILGSYLLSEARTLTFDSENGAVENLVVCGFLYHPVSEADVRHVPATIDEWTWEYLHEHPELVAMGGKSRNH
jgi:hypothetical protein